MFGTTHHLPARKCHPRQPRRDHPFQPNLQLLEDRLAPSGVPELLVHDGSFPYSLTVVDGGTIDFGIIPPAWTPSEKTLTFRNIGTANLTLNNVNPADLPTGFELVSNFTLTTVPPGGSSQLVLKLIPNVVGNFSGSLSILNNDADESPFDVLLTGRVTTDLPPVARTLDMGDTGTTVTAGWNLDGTQGYQGDVAWITNGAGTQIATWEFTDLPSGYYRIWTTWPTGSPRPSNSSYQVFDGTYSRGTHTIDQNYTPNDLSFDGANWRDMGDAEIFNGSLKVTLTDAADSGNIMADAIHIRRIHDLTSQVIFFTDDGDPTFSTQGTWTTGTGGYENDLHASLAGTGLDVARWTFNVSPGTYRVWSTWTAGTDRASNAPFTIKDAAITR
ncbi:MAG: choice-of-anchor D domain-containing protein, partial [Gemmataceae bacterium]